MTPREEALRCRSLAAVLVNQFRRYNDVLLGQEPARFIAAALRAYADLLDAGVAARRAGE